MKTMQRLLSSLVLFTPILSFAFTCPTNFNIINVGDSIESVKAICGKPDSETSKEVPKDTPQEWTYYTSANVASPGSYSTSGTLKSSISFDKDGKVINLSVNGIGVGESTMCGSPIRLGDTRDQVKSACGAPSIVNKQETDDGKPEKDTMTECMYKSNPPATLLFKNGVFTGFK
jgi:hypothetical protein